MSTLEQLQKKLQHYVLTGESAPIDLVTGDARFAEERLSVYRSMYVARLKELLRLDFPTVAALLGDVAFSRLSEQYIVEHPSDNPSARYFPRHFPAFLKQHPEVTAVAAEMAQFEWQLNLTIDAENAETITLDDLQAMPVEAWEDAVFQLHPSVSVLQSRWNLSAFWEASEDNLSLPDLNSAPGDFYYLFWRQNQASCYTTISKPAYHLLQGFLNGETFASICESLCQELPEEQVPSFAMEALTQWVQSTLIMNGR